MESNLIATEQPLIKEQVTTKATKSPKYQGLFSPVWRIRLTGLAGLVLFWVSWRWGSAEMARWSLIPGIIISSAGLLIRIWATGWLCKNDVLVQSGPYAFTRNPLYLGTLLIILGHSLMSAVPLAPILFPTLCCIFYLQTMREEQEYLSARYGAEYAAFSERVPLLIPRLPLRGRGSFSATTPDAAPLTQQFNWARVQRCWKGFLGNSLVIFIYVMLQAYRQ
jgi:protein-S-isoprenylcysteine O-methyltransferase Ste14